MKRERTLRADAVTVLAECIACGQQRDIKAGEVEPGDQPCCDRCGYAKAKTMIAKRTLKALALKRAKRLYGEVTPRLVEIEEIMLRRERHAAARRKERK